MMKRLGRKSIVKWGVALVLTAVVGIMVAGTAAAQTDPPGSKKLQRQINVLERFAGQMLLDSPNFLVCNGSAARGIYIEGYGVLLGFNASIVEKKFDWEWPFDVKIRRDGNQIIIMGDDDEDEPDEEDREEIIEDYKTWQSKRTKQQAKLYERGKQEMIDLLLDYGDSLTRLGAGDWLTLAAFLGEASFPGVKEEKGIEHLVVKAKMSDLRAYGSGDLNEDQMTAKLVIEEY